MYSKKIEEDLDCGIRVAFKIFGGKWKLCIIDAISKGVDRPAAIYKSIPAATPRVLEIQLAELLAFNVVEKQTENTYPKISRYELTDFGRTVLPLLEQIDRWGTQHADFVKERQLML